MQPGTQIRRDSRAVADQLDHTADDDELRACGVHLIDQRG
jgi:hypothetical protein